MPGYLTSTEFVANMVAAVAVIILAAVFYRVAVRLIPRIVQLRRPDSGTRDAAALRLIKRLRYVTFAVILAIGTLFIGSIFLRDLLPGMGVATILAVGCAVFVGILRRGH
jgi:hypothetical protein